MAQRIVRTVRIGRILHGLVDDKVGALERDVHHQLCAVRPVKSAHAFRPEHAQYAVRHGTVRTVVHLQPLLHHCSSKGLISLNIDDSSIQLFIC